MAFRLPTHLPQRQPAYTGAPQPSSLEIRSAVANPQNPHQQHHHHQQQQQEQQQQEQEQQQHEVEESTEWVLFSPSQAGSTTARTHTTSTEKTPRTAGLSQVSDFGSLDSPQSQSEDDELDDDQLEDDTAELDSLDDGLHAFREPSGYRMISTEAAPHDSAILPTHDGLGMFAPSSQDVQDQLWQHEQHNPRRRREGKHRRRSSEQKQLETMEEIQAREIEYDRWRRIEQWRTEQSRALLQEFEKETRWRRNSRAGHAGERLVARQALGSGTWEIDLETNARELGAQEARSSQAGELQDDDGGAGAAAADDESFWRRITRKVIQDLIGIDHSLLSVILGESLVPEQREQDGRSTLNDLSDTTSNRLHEPLNMGGVMKAVDDTPRTGDYWHERLLERIARELGILVHQLCEHPGAFSTYVRSSTSISKQYAGIPIISPPPSTTISSIPPPQSPSNNTTSNPASTYSPHYEFGPTLQDAVTSAFEIGEEAPLSPYNLNTQPVPSAAAGQLPSSCEAISETSRLEREREYWERELDVKMVFHFLRNRFIRNIPFTSDNEKNTSSLRRSSATALSTFPIDEQDPSHRAAIIRQRHPLVAHAHARSQSQSQRSMARQQAQRSSTSISGSSVAGPISPLLRHRIRHPSSSCTSQNARMPVVSGKRTTAGGSGSSRHYWDIGGSVGSGSAVVSAVGGTGTWVDV
ncbi:conserved hypothetical protein [Histoplasma capsulatum G186AR]|uniref:Uncharacterized protein n=2 Tax=Ajellomyces capsulatus TaxID=5037 RepID=C0NCP5_AJECG|nr:uncharacterized protein HCBG_00891 [Histoplasma capsulatum G186AR]EEH11436.1 conserved hypothetical protein [Histoplasma capsulatum G186AR]KAG5302720.1 hypothetical protein I7I52_00447 [Histoplasma capsulatum]QSS71879.1 hypothetical protein I7I50_02887 [Histoplasma capsulatum G186AR]